MNQKILNFISNNKIDTPYLVIDLEEIKKNYLGFKKYMPNTDIFYAVKANPAPEVLDLLVKLGSSFDCASFQEIQLVLSAGGNPSNISFGNTIKKEKDIEKAYKIGVKMFCADSIEEIEKISRTAPKSYVFCRIICDGAGSDWPLSRKFGCEPDMALNVLRKAKETGLIPYGLSFHVGSQQLNINAWDSVISLSKEIFETLKKENIILSMIDLGGGFPTEYLKKIPTKEQYGNAIYETLKKYFKNDIPKTIIEPGRGMVGSAGILKCEIVLISKKSETDKNKWLYLDVGKFGGLAETIEEAIKYKLITPYDNEKDIKNIPYIIAGPTCDSADILYEKYNYMLPEKLKIGDNILLIGAGAYTTTYSAVAFNGFPPLKYFVLY